MSTDKPQLCPMCKNGYLRPIGKASTIGESEEPFTPTVHMRDLHVIIVVIHKSSKSDRIGANNSCNNDRC